MWQISANKQWPYLEETFGWLQVMQTVMQDPRHHAEGSVAIHTQMVLHELINLPGYQALQPQEQEILWAAALLHDVEKYSTTVTEADGSITAKGHARKGALKARQILYKDVLTPFAIREAIVPLVRYHGLPLWLLEKPNPVKQLVKAAMEADTKWLTLLARADALGRICADQQDLLYRIDCFEEFCKEHNCWGSPRPFVNSHARMRYLEQEDRYIDYLPFEMPQTQVFLMSGLPGAGKDSYIKKHFKDLPVISLDQLREDMDIKPTDKTGNGAVIQAAKEQARIFLRKKQSFIWNATNTTLQMRTQLIELFTSYKAAVKIVYVEVPYRQLFKQNNGREAVVPVNIIDKLVKKLEVPALWEAHEVEYHVGT